jgi:hypothetical protein
MIKSKLKSIKSNSNNNSKKISVSKRETPYTKSVIKFSIFFMLLDLPLTTCFNLKAYLNYENTFTEIESDFQDDLNLVYWTKMAYILSTFYYIIYLYLLLVFNSLIRKQLKIFVRIFLCSRKKKANENGIRKYMNESLTLFI